MTQIEGDAIMVDTDKQLVVEPYSGPNRPTIGDYNPNIAWGRQIVEVELRQWKYSARFSVAVGGNCHGLDVLECAISMLYGELPARTAGVQIGRASCRERVCHYV